MLRRLLTPAIPSDHHRSHGACCAGGVFRLRQRLPVPLRRLQVQQVSAAVPLPAVRVRKLAAR